MKKALAALDAEILALALAVLWLLFVQALAVLAWEAELLTRQAALVHWLVVGVLPPALALWSMTPPQRR
ncbi:hypothetical protein [Falsiroseomonas oryzae]|uniref:hypothetical protein n=1 Tax=Falsiroseomonas oryzae TaxID=2766473 RepID=UPI0022EA1E91|nr:hypothetical protein [Roseomonas sp. MO-31]